MQSRLHLLITRPVADPQHVSDSVVQVSYHDLAEEAHVVPRQLTLEQLPRRRVY